MLDHDIHILQQINVPQHVSSYRDDVGILAFAHGADLIGDFHRNRRPVSCRTDSGHGGNVEGVDPGVELAPGGLAVEVHRDAAVRAYQEDNA